MSHGAAEVDKTALSQKDDVLSVLQGETVNLDREVINIFDEIEDFMLMTFWPDE